jgi:hypothetical protein
MLLKVMKGGLGGVITPWVIRASLLIDRPSPSLQGKSPTIDKLARMPDERPIARWIGSQLAAARKVKKKIRIEDIVQDAAGKERRHDQAGLATVRPA